MTTSAPDSQSAVGGASSFTYADLVILVPVLRRPHRVAPLLQSIERATPGAHVVFLADPDDHRERSAIHRWRAMEIPFDPSREPTREIDSQGGNYAAKINRGVQLTTAPLIFTGADDLDFHSGWLEAATAKLAGGIGLVGTNDLCNPMVMAGRHATHFLMTREYAEQPCIDGSPGPLFEGYPHEWVDNELIETAKHRGAYAWARDSHVEHLHPLNGKAPMDELYAAAPERMAEGECIYESRRHLWA